MWFNCQATGTWNGDGQGDASIKSGATTHHHNSQQYSRAKSATSKNVGKLEVVYIVTTDLMGLLKSSFSDKTTSSA